LRRWILSSLDAHASAEHDHLVACVDRVVRDDHPVRGAVRDRQRSGFLVSDFLGHAQELVRGDEAFLGETAVHHLAHEPFFLIERVHQDAVARFPAFDAGTDLEDFTGEVETDDHRHRHFDPGHAAHGEHVVIVERGGAHANDHVPFGCDRIRKIGYVFQLVQPAVLTQYNCSHASSPVDGFWPRAASGLVAMPRLSRAAPGVVTRRP
jgi:hypothetical protein